MSTIVKTSQATVTYPCCSFCGGTDPKGSPKPRKVVLAQFSLYTNPSESFVVWCKKQDEPKGMLWVRSFCVRKGDGGAVELISRSCRGRCSYTLKFSSASEEWYRLLRQESRRAPSLGIGGEEDSPDSASTQQPASAGEDDSLSLDWMLSDLSPSLDHAQAYSDSESDEPSREGSPGDGDRRLPVIHEHTLDAARTTLAGDAGGSMRVSPSSSPINKPQPPAGKKSKRWRRSTSTSKIAGSGKQKQKTTPVVSCNPLQGLGRRKTISCADGAHAVAPFPAVESHEDLSRFSWPLKA